MRKTEVKQAADESKPKNTPQTKEIGNNLQGVNDTVKRKHLGEYEWNLRTDTVRAAPGSWQPKKKKESNRTKAMRHRVRFLKGMPDWRDKLQAAMFTPGTSMQREQALMDVLESSNRLFGDWRVPRAPRISIFGK